MINITPNPVAFTIGPITIPWYGITFALAATLATTLAIREARRRGLNTDLIPDGVIVIFVCGLIAARAYHVIDQWQLYKDDLLKIVLPPYTGLAFYGGLLGGLLGMALYTRLKKMPFWVWADVGAPAALLGAAVGRWGNFFNQELYGPPTNLPWGLAIQCQHRVLEWACPPQGQFPFETTAFHPMFFYESIWSLVGVAALLWLARRYAGWLRPGDVTLIYFMWYATERFTLEFLRAGYNFTFFGFAVTQLIAAPVFVVAAYVFLRRHRADWPPKPSPMVPDRSEEEAPATAGADG